MRLILNRERLLLSTNLILTVSNEKNYVNVKKSQVIKLDSHFLFGFKFSVIIFLDLGRLTQAETVPKNQAERLTNNLKIRRK